MAKIYVLQHHPVESLCNIADALEGAALAWQYVHVNDGQPVPANMKGAGGLVVLGGTMSVYQTERYPWLRDEMRLIADAVKSNLPVLGVCLGAQILAAALGAKVSLWGVVGQDAPAEQFRQALQEAGVEPNGVLVAHDRPTTVKFRVMAQFFKTE